ncbi:hypothetical protein TNCV_2330491 [Trichonephila clavipes]|nr:hypothetical protein TNCV_2330491 [Trichonephila clavipes]
MSAVHRTIGGANVYGFQLRVNEALDALRLFYSATNGVEWYEQTSNDAYHIESVVIWFVMSLHDPSLACAQSASYKDSGATRTATAGSDVVQSGRLIFDDFFQHLWPYIGNNTANVVFQMVKRLWLIRIDQ